LDPGKAASAAAGRWAAAAAAARGRYGTMPALSAAQACDDSERAAQRLAHELLLDPTFQLDESESGGCAVENPRAVFHRIRESLDTVPLSYHDVFCSSFV
jgi:hypothetical protein